MTGYDVTFSTGLIEKLAGQRKPPEPKSAAQAARIVPQPLTARQLGHVLTPDVQRMVHQDTQLARSLKASREVSGLLLRHEAEEAEAIKKRLGQLVKQHRPQTKPPACTAERDACTQCFKDNIEDISRCASMAEAYNQCAFKAFKPQ